MGNPTQAGDICVIITADLFAKINKQRKLLNRGPIENQAIASRCTLRFSVDKQRDVDFGKDTVVIAAEDIQILEKIINELFDVHFENEVRKLCVKPKIQTPKSLENIQLPPLVPETPSVSESTGLLSRLKGLFGGK